MVARAQLHGFLNIDKPAGITSHDVVARVRRLAGQKRVGHAGTLDPAATGVLVVALGNATRLIEYVQEATSKRYLAQIRLGISTTTDDAEGAVEAEHPVPPLSDDALEAVLASFRGAILQVPPMYSALHHQGQRLHELARAGITVAREARPVTIEELVLAARTTDTLTLNVTCSKGTYIRSLARDIGAAIGCGGHLGALRRTAVGRFIIEQAVPLDTLVSGAVFLSAVLEPPVQAVADWPAAPLNAEQAQRVRSGMPVALTMIDGERARLHGPDGELIALAHRMVDTWQPDKVFDWS